MERIPEWEVEKRFTRAKSRRAQGSLSLICMFSTRNLQFHSQAFKNLMPCMRGMPRKTNALDGKLVFLNDHDQRAYFGFLLS